MNSYVLYDATGRVTGLVEGPGAPTPPDGGFVLQVEQLPGTGNWIVSSGVVVARTPTLADGRDTKTVAAIAFHAALIAAGFTYGGAAFQIDAGSQANIAAMGSMALGSITDPANSPWIAGFYWVAADNSHVAMDAASMYAFARAVGVFISACTLRLRAIKDTLAAASDQAALDAVDVTALYPPARA